MHYFVSRLHTAKTRPSIWVLSRVGESWCTWMIPAIYECVKLRIWTGFVAHTYEMSYVTYGWVAKASSSRATASCWSRMSHIAHMNEWCRTYKWVMSHIWKSRVAHINESCCTIAGRAAAEWQAHGAITRHENGATKRLARLDTGGSSFICVTWLIHMCDMTHSHVWHGAFICVTWLIHMCDMMNSYVWHDAIIFVTWLIHMCDMTHSYVWPD